MGMPILREEMAEIREMCDEFDAHTLDYLNQRINAKELYNRIETIRQRIENIVRIPEN